MTALDELNEIIEYITEDKKVKYKATILFDCEIIKDALLKTQSLERENEELKKKDHEKALELIEEMYKKPVYWKLDNGDIASESYSDENIYYDFRKNEVVIYGYSFLASYKVEEYGLTWWLMDESE